MNTSPRLNIDMAPQLRLVLVPTPAFQNRKEFHQHVKQLTLEQLRATDQPEDLLLGLSAPGAKARQVCFQRLRKMLPTIQIFLKFKGIAPVFQPISRMRPDRIPSAFGFRSFQAHVSALREMSQQEEVAVSEPSAEQIEPTVEPKKSKPRAPRVRKTPVPAETSSDSKPRARRARKPNEDANK